MHPTQIKIAHCFNRAMTTYDDHSQLQDQTALKLIHHLKQINFDSNYMIDVGCGTGKNTIKLAQSFSYKKFHAIDNVASLLKLTKNRGISYQIETFLSDFNEFSQLFDYYTLIFSNMALHWSTNIAETLEKLHRALKTNGIIAFAIPLTGTLAELNPEHRNVFDSSELIQRYLFESHFKIIMAQSETFQIQFNSYLEALKSIKLFGGNCLIQPKLTYLLGKNSLKKLFNKTNDPLGKVVLTYQIGFFIAKK